MSVVYRIVRRSQDPAFTVRLIRASGEAYDLTGLASAKIVVSRRINTTTLTLLLDKSLSVVGDPALGTLKREWALNDTDIAEGTYKGQVELVFTAENKVVKFRHFDFVVDPELRSD